jgi:hypothetical protein
MQTRCVCCWNFRYCVHEFQASKPWFQFALTRRSAGSSDVGGGGGSWFIATFVFSRPEQTLPRTQHIFAQTWQILLARRKIEKFPTSSLPPLFPPGLKVLLRFSCLDQVAGVRGGFAYRERAEADGKQHLSSMKPRRQGWQEFELRFSSWIT